jgi:hypothetical protein
MTIRRQRSDAGGCRATPLRLSFTANVTFDAEGTGEGGGGARSSAYDALAAEGGSSSSSAAALWSWLRRSDAAHDAHTRDHFTVTSTVHGLQASGVTQLLVDGQVTLSARWVTLRARWVTLSDGWVTLRARWVTLTSHWVTLRAAGGRPGRGPPHAARAGAARVRRGSRGPGGWC